MRKAISCAVVALAVVTAGCGSSAKPSAKAAGNGAPASNAPRQPGDAAEASATAAPGGKSGSTGTGTGAGGQTGTGASGQAGTKPGSKPAPAGGAPQASQPPGNATTKDGTVHPSHVATEKELPIKASVTPACVMPGATATLNVTTVPKAAIAYVAIYAGEKSGAAAPFGEGHGGNDKGEANHEGNWINSWTVSLTAPTGPARVMLVVGAKGKQRSIDVPFSVGEREAGGCGT